MLKCVGLLIMHIVETDCHTGNVLLACFFFVVVVVFIVHI